MVEEVVEDNLHTLLAGFDNDLDGIKTGTTNLKEVIEGTYLFDAKHTDSDRIRRSVITDTQEECFDRYQRFGARCYIVVSMGFEHFFRIPWDHFRDMKQRLGHLYMNSEELSPYEVKRQQGVLKILDGIELKGESDDQDLPEVQ